MQSTNTITEFLTNFTECIAKERLTKEQFNHKLCEIIFEKNKDNKKLGLFLLNEKVMRDFINNSVWFIYCIILYMIILQSQVKR